MNFTRKAQKPFVLSLMVGLMFLLTACPGGEAEIQPVAADDTYTVEAGETSLEVSADDGVLDNDKGGSLEAAVVANPANGTLALDPDGSFTYTPTTGFTGADSFRYNAVNSVGSDEAVVTITVAGDPGNGPEPEELEAVDDGPYSATIGGEPLTVPAATGLLANDSVPEDATVAIVPNQDDLEEGAVLSVQQDGSFTYTPPADAEEAYTETFTYTLTADEEVSEAATVTINVAAPVTELDAVDDTLTANPTEPTDFTAGQLTVNDQIPNGVTPTITVTSPTMAGGTVVANEDGNYTYTPPADAAAGGTDSFTYTLSADGLDDDTATVNVTLAEEPVPGEGPYDVNFQSQDAPTPANYLADYGEPFGARSGSNQGAGQTYGWVTLDANNMATQTPCTLIGNGRYRQTIDVDGANIQGDTEVLYQTFMHMEGGDVQGILDNDDVPGGTFTGVAENCAWEIAVPNGTYNVSLALGDAERDDNTAVRNETAYQVSVEGNPFPAEPYALSSFGGGSDGSESLFITTMEVGTGDPLTVEVTDGRLTITPTGTNTKITFVNIAAQTEGEED